MLDLIITNKAGTSIRIQVKTIREAVQRFETKWTSVDVSGRIVDSKNRTVLARPFNFDSWRTPEDLLADPWGCLF